MKVGSEKNYTTKENAVWKNRRRKNQEMDTFLDEEDILDGENLYNESNGSHGNRRRRPSKIWLQ